MLEKKESVLAKKAEVEVEKAKEFSKAKNKKGMYSYLYYCIDLLYEVVLAPLICGGRVKSMHCFLCGESPYACVHHFYHNFSLPCGFPACW